MTAPTNQPTIREICEEFRRLDSEIPKAPWGVASNPDGQSQPAFPYVVDSTERPHGQNIITQPLGSSEEVKAVSAFIACARNKIPALVAEVERLQNNNELLTTANLLFAQQERTYEAMRDRLKALETALADAISTFRTDDKTTLITAERQEAWIAALEGKNQDPS